MKVTLPAPAKLNLMLRIVGRRADGYHLLQTVFQFLDLCDTLTFEVTGDGQISRSSEVPGVPEVRDLTLRAARLLQEAAGVRLGVRIGIKKRIPVGGGLGGGSSDAATTLLALNRLWGLDLPLERLMALGLRLGADVPIFLFGRSAWAEGIGERLQELELEEPWFLVLFPGVQVATAEIFGAEELPRNNPPLTLEAFRKGSRPNDCLETVLGRYPAIAEAFAALSRFAPAFLTGTGACLFASFEEREEAEEAAEELKRRWQVFIAKGKNRSPLCDKIKNLHYSWRGFKN